MPLYVQESYVNRSQNCSTGDHEYETTAKTRGELYRDMQREHGRCDGKVYVDTPDGVKEVGWIFVKREKYQDCADTYLQETWITVLAGKPRRIVEYDYA